MKNVAAAIVAVMVAFGLGAFSAFAVLDQEASPALAPADAEEGKICPYCGGKNPADARHCIYCGERFPDGESEYESPPNNGEVAPEDEDDAPGETSRETWYDLTYPEIKRNVLATGFNVAFSGRPHWALWDWNIALGADVAFVLKGLLAVGPTFGVNLARDVDIYHLYWGSAWFGGVAGRVYFRPYYREIGFKPYVGGGYGRCGVRDQEEYREGYYFRYNIGFELVLWPFAADIALGGQREVAGKTRNYFRLVVGLRFFI